MQSGGWRPKFHAAKYCAGYIGRRFRCEGTNVLVILAACINNRTGTDGRPMICKKASVIGRHHRPVRLQNAWLFTCYVSFYMNYWSKEPLQFRHRPDALKAMMLVASYLAEREWRERSARNYSLISGFSVLKPLPSAACKPDSSYNCS